MSASYQDEMDDLDGPAVAYATAWRRADPARRLRLRDDLVRRLIPFADRLAARYRDRSEPLEDVRQVARLGLIKAVDRYDPDRGSFTAYAVSTIRGEVKRHFRDNTWDVHVARRLQDLVLRLGEAESHLSGRLARTPTVTEVADHLGVPESAVLQAQACAMAYTAVPLGARAGDDRPEAPVDSMPELAEHADRIDNAPDRLAVAHLIRTLPERIQQILVLRFYGEQTQMQIAELYGISQMHVSRLLSQALTWLRMALMSDVPPPWPGLDAGDELRVWTSETGEAVTAVVSGEVDRDTATRLRVALHAALDRARGRPLVVDVTRAPLIDVRGAAVLRDLAMAAALRGVTVRLTGVQPYAATVLGTVGLGTAPKSPEVTGSPPQAG
jgi:RNA polymerase sigma-B factor